MALTDSAAFTIAYCVTAHPHLTGQLITIQHPHLSPAETWKTLFKPAPEHITPEEAAELQAVEDAHTLFTPSLKPAHEEMLQILRENEPDTITIVAIGPLTNLALAAAADPEAFLRVKEVVVMGGAVDAPGNVSRPPLFACVQPLSRKPPAKPPISELHSPQISLACTPFVSLRSPYPISISSSSRILPCAAR